MATRLITGTEALLRWNHPTRGLKVDRSFIRDIPADSGDMKIARAIITMSHALKINVVAEGVETLEQLKFLRHERCDAAQGYFLYRPLPASTIWHVLNLNGLQRSNPPAVRPAVSSR